MPIQNAINLIDEQSEKTDNHAIKRIATYILDELLTTDENAEKVLSKEKSLDKCWSFITSKAKKQAVNGCAFVENETVFSWIREYYGIAVLQSTASKSAPNSNKTVSLLDFI